MSAKDAVVGTTKRIVAEIIGDGGLAEGSSRQAAGDPPVTVKAAAAYQPRESLPQFVEATHAESPTMDENRFADLLGHAVLKVWAELPREAQETLFAAAVDDGVIANDLAEFLHDRHTKTAHPPRPTRFA
jgi:hypothetical protein